MEAFSDYWAFFLLASELGLRSVIPTLMGWIPAMLRGGYAGLWVVLFLYLCEFIAPWRKNQRKLREGVWLDVFYTFANFVFFYQLIGSPIFQTAELMFRHAFHGLFGVQLTTQVPLASLPHWAQYVLLFLCADLLSYLGHVLLHRSNFLWTFHRVHHSAKQLDVLNAVRQHWVEKLYYDFFAYIPMALIGFEVQQILAVSVASLLFCTFTHSNLKVPLGPFRFVLNNPQLHLWHHAAEIPHDRNVNYGSALSLWDYLFRTNYLPDQRSELELGFTGIEDFPTTLWGQQIHPFDRVVRKALDWRPLRWVAPLARTLAAGVVVGALGASILGTAIPKPVLLFFHVGYRPHVSALLEEGKTELALDELERAAFIDQDRVDMLYRLSKANQATSFLSPAMAPLFALGVGDAQLRFRIGSAILEQMADAIRFSEAERILGRARQNARLLIALEPNLPRSYYLLGSTCRLEARESESVEALSVAIASFEKALSINPEFPGAQLALAEASQTLAKLEAQ